jgi:hypothetical protein
MIASSKYLGVCLVSQAKETSGVYIQLVEICLEMAVS